MHKKKIQTRQSVGSYGLSKRKVKCSYCGQWIFPNQSHWDVCPSCDGTGLSGSSSRHERGADRDAPVDVYAIYLSEGEYADYQNAASMAMRGTKKEVPCSGCNGSGKCNGCDGTGLSPIQVPSDAELGMPTYCGICAGDGKCSKCFGQKTMLVDSDEGKQEAIEKLQYYPKLVQERQFNETARQNGQSEESEEWDGNQDEGDVAQKAEYEESGGYGNSDDASSEVVKNGNSTSHNKSHGISRFVGYVLDWILGLGFWGILGIIVAVIFIFNIVLEVFNSSTTFKIMGGL